MSKEPFPSLTLSLSHSLGVILEIQKSRWLIKARPLITLQLSMPIKRM